MIERPWSEVLPHLLKLLTIIVMAGAAMNAFADEVHFATPDRVEDYLDSIDRIEGEHGPYALELSDLHIGLGQALFEAGEYYKARDAFHRGVAVMRVNFGPKSPEQTNYLFMLANIELMVNGPQTSGEILDSIYRINTKYYGDDNVELLPVLERLYRTNSAIYPIGANEADYFGFAEAIKLTQRMIRVSENAFGPVHAETALSYRRHGEAQFRMVRHLRGDYERRKPLYGMNELNTARTRSITAAASEGDHLRAGLEAFEEYEESIRLNPSTTVAEYARVLAEIGDWLLLVEEQRKSAAHYRNSCKVLDCSSNDSSRETGRHNQPSPMHLATDALMVFGSAGGSANDSFDSLKLDISMTVTSLGEIKQVKILNPPGVLSDKQLRLIKGQVERNPFRPAMKDGELVTTHEFVWQYEVAMRQSAL